MVALPGCLLVGEPEIEEPTRGQPQLIEVTSTSEMILLRPDDSGSFQAHPFEADLRSEDAGQEVGGVLLINYGNVATDGAQPWEGRGGVTIRPPGTADVLRRISLLWKPDGIAADVIDCKRVTMVVSHSFFGNSPFEYCPTEENDVARLTWFVGLCGASIPKEDCSFDACSDYEGAICPAPGDVQQEFELLTGGN